jgi:hypothetical protein
MVTAKSSPDDEDECMRVDDEPRGAGKLQRMLQQQVIGHFIRVGHGSDPGI